MSYHRTLCLFLLVISPARVAAAPQPPQPAPAAPSPPPPKPDPRATETLEGAIKKLDMKRLGWVEADLWMELNLQGLTVPAQGSYLAGPDNRLHVDLQINLGGTAGTLEVVCDGATFWQDVRLGTGERFPDSHKVDWTRVLKRLSDPDVPGGVREDFFRNYSFAGVAPLLQALRQQMSMTGQDKVRWKGHDVMKLTGSWSAETAKQFLAPGQAWPVLVPRECRLYLDAETGWPYRLEWWGEVPQHAGDALLLQVEFRSPRLNQPPAPERLKRLLSPPTGAAELPDGTDSLLHWIDTQVHKTAPAPGQK